MSKIKHVILENGDLATGLPAGLTIQQLREAVQKFASVKSAFNLYKSRGYKFCIGASTFASVDEAKSRRTKNNNYMSTVGLEFNPTTKEVKITSGTVYQGYEDTTRVYLLGVNSDRALFLEPYCSAQDAREDADDGDIVIELRVSRTGGVVSVKKI